MLADETPDPESGVGTPGIPGAFIESSLPQLRREVGRGASEEAPVGLFDVARGAAAAFSRSAFPLRGAVESMSSSAATFEKSGDEGSEGEPKERVRRRDMVANVVHWRFGQWNRLGAWCDACDTRSKICKYSSTCHSMKHDIVTSMLYTLFHSIKSTLACR